MTIAVVYYTINLIGGDNMAKGGARPGAGAKKNQHRIAAGELREALERQLGMPYVEMLAQTQIKLFKDFNKNENVKEYINFTENMSRRIIEQPVQTIQTELTVDNMSPDEVNARLQALIKTQTTEQISPNSGEILDQE